MMRSLTLLFVVFVTVDVHADSRRYRHRNRQPVVFQENYQPQIPFQPQVIQPSQSTGYIGSSTSSVDALSEVNNVRAQRGLRPYLPDPSLSQAAYACAQQRASRCCSGHLPESDFRYLPAGSNASAAGCAAWTPDWGWGSCCTYDNYTYAGAAWVTGNDGKRYMHLFVR